MGFSAWLAEVAEVLRNRSDLAEEESEDIVSAYRDLYDDGYEVDDAVEEIEREEGLL